MQTSRLIQTVDTHTEGQPTRIITSGLGPLPGATMNDKRRIFREHQDHLRTALLSEPRGHRDMYGCILTAPTRPSADFGILYVHNSGYMDMCGHATIGLSTALVELGMAAATEPVSRIVYDSPAGLVEARVTIRDSRAESVTFRNVAAFVDHLDTSLRVAGVGDLTVDVSYGGNTFVWYRAEEAGLDLGNTDASSIVACGMKVMKAANEQLTLEHCPRSGPRSINIATCYTPTEDGYRNVHVFGPGQFDRSPGGTGTSARLAVLRAKGELELGRQVLVESGITDGVFSGRVVEDTTVDERPAFVTEVTGSAHVTGLHQFLIDPQDALRNGFLP